MSIPGGVTVPSDVRVDLHGDLLLQDLISQVIDSFTSHQNVTDIDFGFVPQGAMDNNQRLREEQRQRLNSRYNGITQPSPEFVQRELLFLYRGEAGSVDLAKESGGRERSVIDTASDDSVRALKKEMKQKIHEWEGSFKHHNQKEAGPHDKAALRPVYEVYKVAKNRITPPEAPPQAASAGPSTGPVSAMPAGPSTAPARIGGSGPAPSATVSAASTRPSSTHTSHANTPLVGSTSGPSSAPAAPLGSSAGQGALPLGRRLSMEEAAIEKRKLKRKLHQFESDFEKRNGRAPQREDRKEYSSEYARYAELKAMLNER